MKPHVKKYHSIGQKLLFVAVLPTLITSLLLGAYFTATRINDVQNNLSQKGSLIAANLSPSVAFGLFSHDVLFLKTLLAPLLNGNDVISILVLDKSRKVVVASISPEYSASELLDDNSNTSVFESAVYSMRFDTSEVLEQEQLGKGMIAAEPELMGWVVVKLSTYASKQRQNEIIINALLFIVLGLGISGFVAYRISRSIAHPILSLTKTVDEISSGDLHSRSNLPTVGELKLLQQGINAMAQTIQDSQNKLELRVADSTQVLIKTIAQLEEKNKTLNATQADLLEANAAKNEFLAKMSHEIRTPLMTVMGFSRLIENTKSEEDIKSYTRLIHRSGTQLLNIIDDILSFSKLEDGHVVANYEDINIRDVIEDAMGMLASSAKEKNIALFLDISNEIPTYLKSDSVKLSQIVMNLLGNAIKFTQSGHVLISACVVDSLDDQVIIRFDVIDTGIGILAEDSEIIFGSFLQVESEKNRSFEGTGLGLAICKKLVEVLSGEIGVDTTAKSGAHFWFTLPMQLSDKFENAHEFQAPKNTVVLYDKSALSRQSVSKLLLSWNVDLYCCETTSQLLELILSPIAVDIVLMSLDFEESVEVTVLDLFQSLSTHFQGRIVFLVSHQSESLRQALSAHLAVEVLEKPLPRQRLHRALFNCNRSIEANTAPDPRVANAHRDCSSAITDFPKQAESSPFNAKTARVLLAEDNEFNSVLIEKLLAERGLDCVGVGDAEAVLQTLQRETFDLLLLDVHMPGMDGIVLANKIRQGHYIDEATPVIAFTADVYIRNNAKLRESGVNDVLYKPVTDEALDTIISRWLPDFARPANAGSGLNEMILSKMGKRLREDVLAHLNNIELSYNVNDVAALKLNFHQLEGMLGYFQFDEVLRALKELKIYALSRHEDKFRKTMSFVTAFVRSGGVSEPPSTTF